MAFTALATTDIAVDKPITNELMTNIKDNFDYLYGLSASNEAVLINPSFEIDSDSDGVPDGWTFTPLAAGSGALSTTDPHHGSKSFVFTRTSGAGNGGGELLSDYIPITTGLSYTLGFALKQSSAQPRTKFIAQFYTAAQTTLANTTVYNSTVNPTAWAEKEYGVLPPANARYCKINIVGGATDKDFAGTIAVDNVRFGISAYGTPVTTGTDLILSVSTEEKQQGSGTLTLTKKTSAMSRSGRAIAIASIAGHGAIQVYRNSSAVGSIAESFSTVYYTTLLESIDIHVNDIIEIWARTIGGNPIKVKDFYVTANDPSILKNVSGY